MKNVKINMMPELRDGKFGTELNYKDRVVNSLLRQEALFMESRLVYLLVNDPNYLKRMRENRKWYRVLRRRISRPLIKIINIIKLIKETDEYGNIW